MKKEERKKVRRQEYLVKLHEKLKEEMSRKFKIGDIVVVTKVLNIGFEAEETPNIYYQNWLKLSPLGVDVVVNIDDHPDKKNIDRIFYTLKPSTNINEEKVMVFLANELTLIERRKKNG